MIDDVKDLDRESTTMPASAQGVIAYWQDTQDNGPVRFEVC
jgi:hypothetical protein